MGDYERPNYPRHVRFTDYHMANATLRAEGTLKVCPRCLYRFTSDAAVCGVCDGPLERVTIFERHPLGPPPLPLRCALCGRALHEGNCPQI